MADTERSAEETAQRLSDQIIAMEWARERLQAFRDGRAIGGLEPGETAISTAIAVLHEVIRREDAAFVAMQCENEYHHARLKALGMSA